MNDGTITLSATLDTIAAKKNGTVVQLLLDGFTTPEDVADLYRMRGKAVGVIIRDPEQPLPLEEASEAREAWQRLDRAMELNANATLVGFAIVALADELADCVTACCNLAERYGLDLQAALDRVEKHNLERGRYE